jgi:hypothetical protein
VSCSPIRSRRGPAGPEVLEVGQHGLGPGPAADEDALGDFQDHGRGVRAGLVEHRATVALKPGLISWRTDTFTDTSNGRSGRSRSHRCRSTQLRSSAHAPITEIRPFCSAMLTVVSAGDAAATGMRPAQQRLDATTAPSPVRTIGWYSMCRSPASCAEHRSRSRDGALAGAVDAAQVDHLVRRTAEPAWPGTSPKSACVSQLIGDGLPRARVGDADSGRDRQHGGFHAERLGERVVHRVCEPGDVVDVPRSSQRITNSSPDTRARVSPGRTTAASRLADLDEQAVADRMAVGVVHRLELVEVDEEHGRLAARTAGPLGGVLEALAQQDPVRQTGQRGRATSCRGIDPRPPTLPVVPGRCSR